MPPVGDGHPRANGCPCRDEPASPQQRPSTPPAVTIVSPVLKDPRRAHARRDVPTTPPFGSGRSSCHGAPRLRRFWVGKAVATGAAMQARALQTQLHRLTTANRMLV